MRMGEFYGWTGKILRADLSSGELSTVETARYAPKYVGGKGLLHRLAWEEIPRGTGAFDPENRLMLATGPLTGTPAPTSGRTEVGGVAPQSCPEMYSHSGFGGWFGAELKYAGFDAVVIQGEAPAPCYLLISDGRATLQDAGPLWGLGTYGTQKELMKRHGAGVKSLVIGPAGEHRSRIAVLLTESSNAAGQGGFGGVAGAKKLKAICVQGTQSVQVARPDELLEVRRAVSRQPAKNPLRTNTTFAYFSHQLEHVPYQTFNVACTHACDQFCMPAFLDVPHGSHPTLHSAEVGCTAQVAVGWEVSEAWEGGETMSWPLWRQDLARGMEANELLNDYGLNQYEVLAGMVPWLAMCAHEGLLTEKELGFPVEPDKVEWWTRLLHMLAYREGMGDLLAEGTTRAINMLGKEKYGATLYTGERSYGGKARPTPVSLQQAWGYAEHNSGRGLAATLPFPDWLLRALTWMTQSRDSNNDTHHKARSDWMAEFREDPYRGSRGPWLAIWNENRSEFKCSLVLCDWAFPQPYFANAEAYLYTAVTGQEMTALEADRVGERLKNLQRAVLMRNHDRSRAAEVGEILPFLKRPDGSGTAVDEAEFNIMVDHYYEQRGWDKATGWPTRAKLEELDLGDVAQALASLGKLPTGPGG